MRYHALACDYDGTIAHHGSVSASVIEALDRVRRSGRKIVLVTGRKLDDLRKIFPELECFDRIVAENGALLHRPESGETSRLGPSVDLRFVAALQRRGVTPLDVGECIVATWEPNQDLVLDTIKVLGLELQVIFNKGAVMVLPGSINKATGLRAALLDLGLSPRNAVGVGDAENDNAMLALCECAVAVQNALPALRDRADWVTAGDHGAGVIELIEELLQDDLASHAPALTRHDIALGRTPDDRDLSLPAFGASVLVTGSSGGGKSTFATGLIERIAETGAQLCVLDPEGDYPELEGMNVLGSADRPPDVEEVMRIVEHPGNAIAINLIGERLESRPAAFSVLLSRLLELRTRSGRPHWLLVDEAHHVLPRDRRANEALVPAELRNVVWITVHPDAVAPSALADVGHVIVVGLEPEETLARVATALSWPKPELAETSLAPGEALYWNGTDAPHRFRTIPPRSERRRHVRKYAEGALPEDRSFFFRGPDQKLRLRASNLMMFLELADGVDDGTWSYHLRRQDYSQWLRAAIKDEALADEMAAVETSGGTPAATREGIRAAIESRYTAPAQAGPRS